MAIGYSATLAGYSSDGGAFRGGGLTPDVSTGDERAGQAFATHSQLKRKFSDFHFNKRRERKEQDEARHYRHGDQWTAKEISTLNDRRQPVVTYNRISRKIDGICGIVERQRAQPRAFPRSPKFQQGADLATAALRAALEQAKWKRKSPKCAETGATEGYGGIELKLTPNPDGSYDIDLETVDPIDFFYDPRSKEEDFSDATYMGCGKWVDAEVLKDRFPDKISEIEDSLDGSELTDEMSGGSEAIWLRGGELKTVRVVYICYQHRGQWCWCLFTHAHKLMEGTSPFIDRHGKTVCSYVMYSAAVDHDWDRYGFPRHLKSPQDEINQRRSKGLHEQNTRRIVGEIGAFDDIEKVRREAVRPDGVVLRNKGYEAEFDDAKKVQDVAGQLKFLEDAKLEIENFGPNPALLGEGGISNRSGRAINLMQQAGIAELGPYMISFASWKHRVYEQLFYAIKKYWQNERWIRLTDDEGQQQFVQLNAMQMGPYGVPQIVNSIGELDVDIVLDEGPDNITVMQDFYEALSQMIPAVAPMLSPQQVQSVLEMLFDISPLPAEAKRKFKQASMAAQQPDPAAEMAKQIQLAGAQAEVEETQSKTMLNMAKAQAEGMPDAAAPMGEPPPFELPPNIQVAKAFADIDKTTADADHKRSLADRERTSRQLEPIDYVQKAQQAMHDRQYDAVDLRLRKYEADQARQRPANGGG